MRESWGLTKPKGATKVKAASGRPRQDPGVRFAAAPAHCRPVSEPLRSRRSKSAHAGTRKMVNYA